MKKEMIKVYRRSSPRTGRAFDTLMILSSKKRHYLAAGYTLDPPDKTPEYTLPEEMDYIPLSMLNAEQIEEIRNAEGTQKQISKKFHISTFTTHKIKSGKV
jgi:hypothetical protein